MGRRDPRRLLFDAWPRAPGTSRSPIGLLSIPRPLETFSAACVFAANTRRINRETTNPVASFASRLRVPRTARGCLAAGGASWARPASNPPLAEPDRFRLVGLAGLHRARAGARFAIKTPDDRCRRRSPRTRFDSERLASGSRPRGGICATARRAPPWEPAPPLPAPWTGTAAVGRTGAPLETHGEPPETDARQIRCAAVRKSSPKATPGVLPVGISAEKLFLNP